VYCPVQPSLVKSMIDGMKEEKEVVEVARDIFRDLESGGINCVILHHFDFEEGGDIDFSADVFDLDLFLLHLKSAVERARWNLVQVFIHEQTGAYIVCRDLSRSGRYLLLDYCYDYRIRGHLILSGSELVWNSHALSWGGKGSSGLIELIYRFSKAAAKEKSPKEITKELKGLWENHHVPFDDWLRSRWGLQIKDWDEATVSLVLDQLRRRLAKKNWSTAELKLKIKRLLKPRGLWVECPDEMKVVIGSELAPCFRNVMEGCGSLKPVLGSTLILASEGTTHGWKRKLLKLMRCWLEASSGEEVVQFLIDRNDRYQKSEWIDA